MLPERPQEPSWTSNIAIIPPPSCICEVAGSDTSCEASSTNSAEATAYGHGNRQIAQSAKFTFRSIRESGRTFSGLH